MKFFLFLQVLLKLWWRPLCRLFSVSLNFMNQPEQEHHKNNIWKIGLSHRFCEKNPKLKKFNKFLCDLEIYKFKLTQV